MLFVLFECIFLQLVCRSWANTNILYQDIKGLVVFWCHSTFLVNFLRKRKTTQQRISQRQWYIALQVWHIIPSGFVLPSLLSCLDQWSLCPPLGQLPSGPSFQPGHPGLGPHSLEPRPVENSNGSLIEHCKYSTQSQYLYLYHDINVTYRLCGHLHWGPRSCLG